MAPEGLMGKSHNSFHKQSKSHFSQFCKFELFVAVILPIVFLHEFPRLTLKLQKIDDVPAMVFFLCCWFS